MSSPAQVFHLFPQLPLELREEIWRLCLPHRIYELDMPGPDPVEFYLYDSSATPLQRMSVCRFQETTWENGRPPLIFRVCRESRSVALKAGKLVDGEDRPGYARWTSQLDALNAWRDPTRDSVHLNWTPGLDPEVFCTGKAIECLAWEASRLVSERRSLMLRYLDPAFGSASWAEHEAMHSSDTIQPLEEEKLDDIDALQRLPTWQVVMEVLLLHCDRETANATGLFGLLGDAPVQIVDASDAARLDTYLSFAEACERRNPVAMPQTIDRDSVASMQHELRAAVLEQLRSEELAAAMRPAIMFRLCPQTCSTYHHRHGWGGSGRGACWCARAANYRMFRGRAMELYPDLA